LGRHRAGATRQGCRRSARPVARLSLS
jgi:hypothetical protein